MIFAILGRPGGGKSYEATRYHILPALLEDKRRVITNIPVNKDHIAKIHGQEYADLVEVVDGSFHSFGGRRPFSSSDDFLKYDEWRNEKGQGVMFVIDESHLSLGRDAQKEVLEYLSMHRHYGHDIGLLTQNQRKLNRDLRDMVEVAYYCAKMTTYGEAGYVRKTFHGLDNMRDPVHVEERSYDSPYFSYYQSHTKSNSSVQEATVKDSGAVRNPYKKVTICFFVVGILMLVFLFGKLFLSDDDEQKTVKNTPTSLPAPSVPPAAQPPQEQKPVSPPVQTKRIQTENEKIELTREEQSKQYHPFHKVSIHISGSFHDYGTGESKVFFSASRNGQTLFNLGLKELLLAGYEVTVFSECAVEITYYKFRDFVTCDTPTMGVSSGQLLSKSE